MAPPPPHHHQQHTHTHKNKYKQTNKKQEENIKLLNRAIMFIERAIWPFTYNHTQKKVCSILVLALAVINVFPISLQYTLIYNHAFVNSILCSKLFLDVFKFSKKNYSFILIQFCYRTGI